jgi:hypothetical protein
MAWGRRTSTVGLALAVTLGCTIVGRAVAQQSAPTPEQTREQRNQIPNTPGDGPYPATLGTDPGLPGHVIYRPADLAPFDGGKLPVVIWGNGACADDGTAHRFHLAEIASYGYLVVAAGHWRSGPGATDGPLPPRAPTDGGLPPPATTAEDVLAGLDWALAENARAGSELQGRIATDKVAVAGHSCGGLQAIELADDPRIDTVMVHNSGIFNSGVSSIPTVRATKDMLKDFHQPVIYILGGPDDIAYPNGTDDYARIDHVPVVMANLPVGHGGTFGEPMGGAVAHVAVDWLEWQLRGDTTAARTFLGENCRLCTGTDWSIEKKNW